MHAHMQVKVITTVYWHSHLMEGILTKCDHIVVDEVTQCMHVCKLL